MKIVLFFAIILSLVSCKSKIENVERAFYYWKSGEWSLSGEETRICDSLDIQKMYVKFFEVDYNEEMGSFPISKTHLTWLERRKLNLKSIVPTVYLQNIVFRKSSKEDLDILADNVNFLIHKYQTTMFGHLTITEFQMDCDWTIKTKDNYFYFLKKLKAISGKQISATLRLYPYKYRQKMGVPPVDKVTLMCYNLLSPLENASKNSILDFAELKSYLKDAQTYPKHLDIALPIYSWAQVYHNELFSSMLHVDTKHLKTVFKKEKPLWYIVTKDTVIDDIYLRVGDRIKHEEMDATKVNAAIVLLKRYVNFDKNITVALFDLDDKNFTDFTDEELSAFYISFSN